MSNSPGTLLACGCIWTNTLAAWLPPARPWNWVWRRIVGQPRLRSVASRGRGYRDTSREKPSQVADAAETSEPRARLSRIRGFQRVTCSLEYPRA